MDKADKNDKTDPFDILKIDIENIDNTDVVNEFSKFTEKEKLIIKTSLLNPGLSQHEIGKLADTSNIYVCNVLNKESVSKFISRLQLQNGFNRIIMNFVLSQEAITKNLNSKDDKVRDNAIKFAHAAYEKFLKQFPTTNNSSNNEFSADVKNIF